MTPWFNHLVQRLRGGSDFEPSAPADFTAHKSQAGKRGLHADRAAGRIAAALLRGRRMTVQDIVRMLESHGIVTNHPLSRIKEAIAWLEKNSVRVEHQLEGKPGNKHKRWFVSTLSQGPDVRNAKVKLGVTS